MKIDYKTNALQEEYIKNKYESPKKDIVFRFCEKNNVKGTYKITRDNDGVIIENQEGKSKRWPNKANPKRICVGGLAIAILDDKNSVTFEYDEEVESYDVIQADGKVNFLKVILKK